MSATVYCSPDTPRPAREIPLEECADALEILESLGAHAGLDAVVKKNGAMIRSQSGRNVSASQTSQRR